MHSVIFMKWGIVFTTASCLFIVQITVNMDGSYNLFQHHLQDTLLYKWINGPITWTWFCNFMSFLCWDLNFWIVRVCHMWWKLLLYVLQKKWSRYLELRCRLLLTAAHVMMAFSCRQLSVNALTTLKNLVWQLVASFWETLIFLKRCHQTVRNSCTVY